MTLSETKEKLDACMNPLLVSREEFARTIHPQTREGKRHPHFSGYDRWDSLTGAKRQDNVYQNWRMIKDERIKVTPTGAYVPEKADTLTFYNKTPLRFDRPGGKIEINRNLLGVMACDSMTCKLVSVFWD